MTGHSVIHPLFASCLTTLSIAKIIWRRRGMVR